MKQASNNNNNIGKEIANKDDQNSNDINNKLVKAIFKESLCFLESLELKKSKSRIFLIYAADEKAKDTAETLAARQLIKWLAKLKINLYSNQTNGNGSDPWDVKLQQDILWKQLYLLPTDERSCDYVIVCCSPLLDTYHKSQSAVEYYDGISKTLNHLPPSKMWHTQDQHHSALSYLNDTLSRKYSSDIHRVLTELSLLQYSPFLGGKQTVLPVLLDSKTKMPEFIKNSQIAVAAYKEEEMFNNEGLHLGFFALLEQLFVNDQMVYKEIVECKKSYKTNLDLIRQGKLSTEEVNSLLSAADKKASEKLDKQLKSLNSIFNFGFGSGGSPAFFAQTASDSKPIQPFAGPKQGFSNK